MDRLTAMRTFRTVVETGGFSAAARRLGLSKAAVSKQVAELEAHFGTALLHRTTRRLNATDAGRRYFENAVRLLDELTEVEAEVRHSQTEPSGRLRISAPINFGNAVLGPVICAIAQRYPKLEIQVELNDRFVDLIEEGFDAALRIRTSLPDSSLIARRLQQHHAVGVRGAQLSQARGNAEDAGGSEVTRMPDLHLVDLALRLEVQGREQDRHGAGRWRHPVQQRPVPDVVPPCRHGRRLAAGLHGRRRHSRRQAEARARGLSRSSRTISILSTRPIDTNLRSCARSWTWRRSI